MPTATYFLPVQDVYISSAYGDTNFYAPPQGEVLFAGSYTGADDIYRTLLQFDLWGANRLPPNITIISAYLQLYMYRNDNVNVATLNGYSILESFNQQIVTFIVLHLFGFQSLSLPMENILHHQLLLPSILK